MATPITVIVANAHSGPITDTKREAFAGWVKAQGADVTILSEAAWCHDQLRTAGSLYAGTGPLPEAVPQREVAVVLRSERTRFHRTIKLTDGLGTRVAPARWVTRVVDVIAGWRTVEYSFHAHAGIQDADGTMHTGRAAQDWTEVAQPLLERLIRSDLDMGREVIVGGDGNMRNLGDNTLRPMFTRLGLTWAQTELLWVAWSSAFTLSGTPQRLPNPPGSDHVALRVALTPKEIPMPETPKTDALVAALRRRGVVVLEHGDWGAREVPTYRRRLTTHHHGLLPAKPVDTIWHHITVTFDTGPLLGEFKADLRKVEAIGMQRFGSGISYNLLVDNGGIQRVALGQFLEAKGTHTVNDLNTPNFSHDQNLVALGIAFVGMPGDELTPAAVETFVQIEAALIEIGACTKTYDCVPHSLVAPKACPTDTLRDKLPAIRRRALADAEPEPTVTRVTKGRELIDQAADLLAATPDSRHVVHAAAGDLRTILQQLPER